MLQHILPGSISETVFFIIVCGFSYLACRAVYSLLLEPFLVYVHYRRQGVACLPFIPVFGNLLHFLRYMKADNHKFFVSHYLTVLGADHFLHFLGPVPRLVIGDPISVSHIMHRDNLMTFQKNTLGPEVMKIVGNGVIFLPNGAEHDWHRRMIAPSLRLENLKSMLDLMFTISDRTMKYLPTLAVTPTAAATSSTEPEKPLAEGSFVTDLHQHFSMLALDIVCSCVFGQSIYEVTKDGLSRSEAGRVLHYTFTTLLDSILANMLSLRNVLGGLSGALTRDVRSALKEVDTLAYNFVASRMAGKTKSLCKGQDLLDILIDAQDENGKKFTPEEIRNECRVFIFAGFDTTASLMSWTAYLLYKHPHVLSKLRTEIDLFYTRYSSINLDNIGELEYLSAVINESLREYAPLPALGRKATVDTELPTRTGKKIKVLKGTTVFRTLDYLHHNKVDWGEDADEFKPERWLKQTTEESQCGNGSVDNKSSAPSAAKRPAAAFFPFNAGNRGCIGQHFAIQEAKIVIAHFLHCYDYEVVEKRMVPTRRITASPKYGMKSIVTPRVKV